MDDAQRSSVFHSLRRSVTRWDPRPEAPSPTEWRTWLTDTSETLTHRDDIPAHMRRRIQHKLDAARRDTPPGAADFAALQALASRVRRVKYAQWDQASQIGAWANTGPRAVSDAVAAYRSEWEQLSEQDRLLVPEQYARGWRITSPGMPKDDATIYAHWKVETQHAFEPDRRFPQYVAVDVETTGISTKDSHIIEIGCVTYDESGVERDRWSTFVRPPEGENGTLSTGPVEVHGITPTDVEDAPSIHEALAQFEQRTQGACLIGHNLAFDLKHLRVSIDKDREFSGLSTRHYPWVAGADTYWKAARTLSDLPDRKLATVAAHYGVGYSDGHRALHDAHVAGEVFFAMRNAPH